MTTGIRSSKSDLTFGLVANAFPFFWRWFRHSANFITFKAPLAVTSRTGDSDNIQMSFLLQCVEPNAFHDDVVASLPLTQKLSESHPVDFVHGRFIVDCTAGNYAGRHGETSSLQPWRLLCNLRCRCQCTWIRSHRHDSGCHSSTRSCERMIPTYVPP